MYGLFTILLFWTIVKSRKEDNVECHSYGYCESWSTTLGTEFGTGPDKCKYGHTSLVNNVASSSKCAQGCTTPLKHVCICVSRKHASDAQKKPAIWHLTLGISMLLLGFCLSIICCYYTNQNLQAENCFEIMIKYTLICSFPCILIAVGLPLIIIGSVESSGYWTGCSKSEPRLID